MPKKNKTACKRQKCQRSRIQGRRRNNNRRTRTIRGGISPFRNWNTTRRAAAASRRAVGTETYQRARWNSPVRMWHERNMNIVVPDSQIQQPSYNSVLQTATNSFYEEASAARRSIINNNRDILKLLQEALLTANTKQDQNKKLQAVINQEKFIRKLEQEDARLRVRAGLPEFPPDNIPDAVLGMNRLTGRVDNYNADAAAAHQTATSELTNQTSKVNSKMAVLDKELRRIGE